MGFPHLSPHTTSFTWQGMPLRRVWPPAHCRCVSTVQGGQASTVAAGTPEEADEDDDEDAAPPPPPLPAPAAAAPMEAAVGWHVCHGGCGWPQGRCRLQGREHWGGSAPHGMGGIMTAPPHVQVSGTLLFCTMQCPQLPAWHRSSQKWRPHARGRPHRRRHM